MNLIVQTIICVPDPYSVTMTSSRHIPCIVGFSLNEKGNQESSVPLQGTENIALSSRSGLFVPTRMALMTQDEKLKSKLNQGSEEPCLQLAAISVESHLQRHAEALETISVQPSQAAYLNLSSVLARTLQAFLSQSFLGP